MGLKRLRIIYDPPYILLRFLYSGEAHSLSWPPQKYHVYHFTDTGSPCPQTTL